MRKLAVFASGTGSNAKNIIQHFNNNGKAKIALIVSNNAKAGVLEIAQEFNVPTLIITKDDILKPARLIEQLHQNQIGWIVLAGFLWKIPEEIVKAFNSKIINIHPALLPKFGGKGMYGSHVHKAVKDAAEKETGITIHFVNENYDEGNIIVQHKCFVNSNDSVKDIEKKVRALEAKYFPLEIEKIID